MRGRNRHALAPIAAPWPRPLFPDGIAFSLHYTGIALAAKTFYGQTLESNHAEPYAAFGLTRSRQGLVSLANGFSGSAPVSIIAVSIGIAARIAVAANRSPDTGAFNGGAVFVLAAHLQNLFALGAIAEVTYATIKTNGRSFFTPRLALLLVIETIIVIVLNARRELVACVTGIVAAAFLHNALRARHIIAGLAAGVFFISVLTPVTIYLRIAKEGMPLSQFVELAGETVARLVVDPGYLKQISDSVESAAYQDEQAQPPYDYYGDRSNVLNRLSFVALTDAVYNATQTREPIGMAAIEHALARIAPGFLGYDKEVSTYGMGDFLSWHTGLSEPGSIAFLNYPLPMEGLATWGLAGFIAYPVAFMAAMLYLCATLSSFRLPLPVSIALFTSIQGLILEATSDELSAWMTRVFPLDCFILFVLYKVLITRGGPLRAPAVNARYQL